MIVVCKGCGATFEAEVEQLCILCVATKIARKILPPKTKTASTRGECPCKARK